MMACDPDTLTVGTCVRVCEYVPPGENAWVGVSALEDDPVVLEVCEGVDVCA